MSPNNFNPVFLIRKKRDGKSLSSEEIRFIIDEYTEDRLPDYQMSAFIMAGFLQGFDDQEASALAEAMLHSGEILDFSNIPGKKVDKHSTGGVGDKLSLILAPVVASCGVPVPMICGRGLGHTGGTLDKLESIPGFQVNISLNRFRQILKRIGIVMAGQTDDIAPADKRLYALRDVTATVESIPLIASSIMSKKLAEDINALVLDIKFGSGAFMNSIDDALELAERLVAIGEKFDIKTIGYLTDMNQPLGYNIGNWLEVVEAVESLQGNGPADVMEITHKLAGTMIYLGDKAASIEEGIAKSKEAVKNGQAFQKWLEVVEQQGGDKSVILNPETYPYTAQMFEFKANKQGYIRAFDAYELGMSSLELGAGRRKKEDTVDPGAGIVLKKKIGDYVNKGETIACHYTNKKAMQQIVLKKMTGAVTIGTVRPERSKLITHIVDSNGIQKLEI